MFIAVKSCRSLRTLLVIMIAAPVLPTIGLAPLVLARVAAGWHEPSAWRFDADEFPCRPAGTAGRHLDRGWSGGQPASGAGDGALRGPGPGSASDGGPRALGSARCP